MKSDIVWLWVAALLGAVLNALAQHIGVDRDCDLLGKTHIGKHVLVCEVKS